SLQGAILNKAKLRGADLSMANLRGASLVQADLRDANLLGTELRGANLMGASLYGAEGLWVGRLGGTNLFDAMLPETVSSFDGAGAVAEVTRSARWFYLLMLAVTVACVEIGRACVGKECRYRRDWSSDVCSSDLPETVSSFDGAGAVAEVTRSARWFYLLMLAVTVACV